MEKWFRRFEYGREDVEDYKRTGRPSTIKITTTDNGQLSNLVRDLLLEVLRGISRNGSLNVC